MKRIFSILLIVALVSGIAICAVACNKEFSAELTDEVAREMLFGQEQVFALMDEAVNFSVEYSATGNGEKTAGIAKLVLDETNGENFVSIYANSSYAEEDGVANSTNYMFYTWEAKKNGELEKTLVFLSSYKGDGSEIEPEWEEYGEYELDSSEGTAVKNYHKMLLANCGAHHGISYVREGIFNENDDVYDTIQVTGTGYYADKDMTDMNRAEIVIKYNYLDGDEKSISGTATIILEKKVLF